MKLFIKKILLFTVLFAVCAYTIDYAVTSGLRKTGSGEIKTWNEIYNKEIDSDIIIMGSSRARVHICPQILDTILNVNSYNIALNGATIEILYYQKRFFEKFISKPKTIIINTDHFTLKNRIGLKRPFLAYSHERLLREDLQKMGFSSLEIHLPAFRYFSAKLDVIRGLLEFFKIKHFSDLPHKKGYRGEDRSWNPKNFENIMRNSKKGSKRAMIEPKMVEILDNFLFECKQNDVQVIMVCTPLFYKFTESLINNYEIIGIYENFSNKYDFPFLDYSIDSICYESSYFFDIEHLNKKGSEIFSTKLAHDIDSLGLLK